MSSFAAGFFRSLERNSQAQLDAQREQMRMEAAKKLDLKYQRNKRIEKRGADWYEITTDGEGAEIPGLARKLNEAEVAKIKGDMASSNVAVAEAEDVLDPEYRALNKSEKLEDLRFKGEERGFKRNQDKRAERQLNLYGQQVAQQGRDRGGSSLEGKGWEAASPDTKLADIYNSLGREIQAAIQSKVPEDPDMAEEGASEMALVYKNNIDAVIANILSRSKSREEAMGKVRRYLTTGTVD